MKLGASAIEVVHDRVGYLGVLDRDNVGRSLRARAIDDHVDDLAADVHGHGGVQGVLDGEDRRRRGNDEAVQDDDGRADRQRELLCHELADDVGSAGISARAENKAQAKARNHTAPQGAKQKVAVAEHRQIGHEGVGKDATGDDADDGADDIAAVAALYDEHQQEDVHHDRLKADGQIDPHCPGKRVKHRRQARDASGRKAVRNLKAIDAHGKNRRANDDEREVAKTHTPARLAHSSPTPGPPRRSPSGDIR